MKIFFLWSLGLFIFSSQLFSDEATGLKENSILYAPIKKAKLEVKKDLLLILENCPKTLQSVRNKKAMSIDTRLEKDNCERERTGRVEKLGAQGLIELIIRIYGHGNIYSLLLEDCPDVKKEAEILPKYFFYDFPVVYQIKLACKNESKIFNARRDSIKKNKSYVIPQVKKDSSL